MRAMDGFLLIDKPAGMTSHDVVDRVRRTANTRRVGHAGTLDPFATGLLILGINKATKGLNDFVGLDKTYEATATLGATSTTDDPEGTITNYGLGITDSNAQSAIRNSQSVIPPSRDDIEQAFNRFRGGYVQTAPAFSAKKVGGKKLYELARKGTVGDVELPKKDVKIHELVIALYDWPTLTFRVSCSSGTYVRALARDIGEALGVGAYLTELRRTKIGTYEVANALRLDDLNEQTLQQHLISLPT